MPEPSWDEVVLTVDGRPLAVRRGANLAAVLAASPGRAARLSLRGEPRGPVCGMGICFECRVTLDGAPQVRACLEACRDGMVVETGCDVAGADPGEGEGPGESEGERESEREGGGAGRRDDGAGPREARDA